MVDCHISSYCCLKPRSSARTVLLSVSRKLVVFWSCFFSTLVNASRRILDCSSMYLSERVEFVSRSWRRRETALKKLSWIVGREEVADEVLVVLFFWELATVWVLLPVEADEGVIDVLFAADAIAEAIDSLIDEVMLVTLEATGTEEASAEELSETESSDCEVAAGVRSGEAALPADGGSVAVALSASSSTVELLSDSGS